jgi:ComEC/Rec2-related protein
MNRPLVAVVSFYAAGLLLAGVAQPPLAILFAATLALLLPAIIFRRWRGVLIWPMFLFIGWTNLVFHTAVISPQDLRDLMEHKTEAVMIRGELAEPPHLKITEYHEKEMDHTLVRVKVTALKREATWQSALGEIIVATPGTLGPEFFTGQRVEIAGVLARPPPPVAPGLFDYRDYLQNRGIFYELKTRSTNDWELGWEQAGSPWPSPPLTDRFLTWSRGTLALGLPAADKPLKLLWAMTLGWRTAFSGDISEPFLRAGTMHMFAIDGLRIALISGMLVALLRGLQVSRAWCGVVAIPIIWFYVAATGWEASAIRASVMMTIIIGGWALKRPADLLNSLAVAALIILLGDPRQLFQAGFQLSFCVVLVIAVMLPAVNEWMDQRLQSDPLLPTALVPGWQKKLFWWAREFGHYCALSLAAWVGSIPLSIKYFHLFSLVSIPANIVAVPLGTLALVSNLGALICGHWLPFATTLFNQAAWFFMAAMTWVSEECSRIPGGYLYVPDISWFTVALYYVVVLVLFSGWLNNWRRKITVAIPLLLVGMIYFGQWVARRGETHLAILPLGGGHAVYVNAPGSKNDWLMDCGNASDVQFTLKDFLRAQGVNHLPRLALTDGVARDCGGAPALAELFGIGELWTSGLTFKSPVYRQVMASFKKTDPTASRHKIFQPGNQIGDWQALYPGTDDKFTRADDDALVLLGSIHGTKILLLSDLGTEGQGALLAQAVDLHADIVVAGLPTKGEPLSPELLAAIQPKLIIVADSDFPASRRAGDELKGRLTSTGIPVIYTRTAGAVSIVVDKHGWLAESMEGQKFRGNGSW